ncbi:MAG: ROK family protein [Bifidobacterium sp.]
MQNLLKVDADSSRIAIGMDIGGTKLEAAIVTLSGDVIESVKVPTASNGPAVLAQAIAVATNLKSIVNSRGMVAAACGVGTAGVVDKNAIVSANSLIPGWAGQPLQAELESRLGIPTHVINDVYAVAIRECLIGVGRNQPSTFVTAVGTGVGSALVLNGKLWEGEHGLAGSLGHIPSMVREGRACACGAIDHVESYAGGRAIEKEFAKRCGRKVKMPEIAAMARSGDTIANQLLDTAGLVLGQALASVAALIDPKCVVLDGGMMALGDLLLNPVRELMKREAMISGLAIPLSVTPTGTHAGVVGAALHALSQENTHNAPYEPSLHDCKTT